MSISQQLQKLKDGLAASDRMPVVFLGHGSPMNAIEDNAYSRSWAQLGRNLPRPQAILVVSAHWMTKGSTLVNVTARPETIHDFYGFPQALFDFDYPAPGAPDVAQEIAEVVKPEWVGLDRDQWGLDHGTWSVLAHLYPQADVPVVQLSINALRPLEYHVDIAARLAALRDSGVAILASGNVVHNLREIQWDQPNTAFDWAERFDDAVVAQLADAPSDILRVREHPDYARAVPTPDHFVPLLYLAGLAAAEDARPEPIVRGFSMGSISMTCHALGANLPVETDAEDAATLPRDVPADQTNI